MVRGGSETARVAVKEAIRPAKALGGELHITSSYKPVTAARIPGAPPDHAGASGRHPDFHVEAVLDEAAATARAAGVTATTHASRRDPTDALLGVAETVDAAMIVVGTRGMHGMDRFTVGNVPNQVSHKGMCNVLIAYTGEPEASGSQ